MHLQPISYDPPLVVLSFVAALMASYAALDMGSRLRRATGRARLIWLVGSSVVLGGGIWSMHFIAMLAVNAGVPIGYDFDLTALSLVISVAIVAVGLHLVARPSPSIVRQLIAGAIVGAGVCAMHYTGMAAMMVDGTVRYDPLLVSASLAIAVVAATVALWLTLNLTRPWQRIAAAVVMAIAVCGMHYTAMAAASILCGAEGPLIHVDPTSKLMLAGAVALSTFMILCLAMVCVFADRRFEFLAEREAESLRSANRALTESQGAIKDLLDNADQGFLTVGPDLTVGAQSSAACEAILGGPPAGRSIVELLRPSDGDAGAMQDTLRSVFQDSSELARELKLELLPTELRLGETYVRAAYKFLAARGELMVILTDVTQTQLLAQEVDRERKRLEMIVLAVTEGEAFAGLARDYEQFLAEELADVVARISEPGRASELYRRLHTFKGLLAQFSFPSSPTALHEIESQLAASEPAQALDWGRLRAAFERDLTMVTDALGADYAASGKGLKLSSRQLEAMERVAKAALLGEDARTLSPPVRLLLQTLADLGRMDVKAALALHARAAPALAARLEKELAPIAVEGDDVTVPPEWCDDFIRSLVHVFRNAVDHGIEEPEEREALGKPAAGAIRCAVRGGPDGLEIAISDDGCGIDRAGLEARLVAGGEDAAAVHGLSLEDLVFREGLSLRSNVTDISGRGVGLSAVRSELARLHGEVQVTSELGAGTCFRFRLPVRDDNSTTRSAAAA